MDGQEKHRFVQQYLERQKAYIPLYATGGPPIERPVQDTALRSDEFGFDTPILRPRVSKVMNPPAAPTRSSPRTQDRRVDPPRPKSPPLPMKTKVSEKEAVSRNRNKVMNEKRHKSTSKRHSTPASNGTDDERAPRLADRRQRKRMKRAIVNPKPDESTTAMSRTKGQKAKKPAASAALALMYGFSATNVTKDRLTVKPAPSLGVFSKGKASSKKKTSATKKPTSKKELFSESAFLNRSSAQASKVARTEGSSNDSSLSSVSDRPAPKKPRTTKKKQTPLGEGKETPTSKTPEGLVRPPTESEIWDIELQSNLPSSVPEVSSENGAKATASVVLNLQGAKWSTSVGEAEEHSHKVSSVQDQSKGPSIGHSSALARSHLGDDRHLLIRNTDTSTILPCHSASQVGRLVADIHPPAPRLVTSKYFTAPVSVHKQSTVIDVDPPQGSSDSLGVPHGLIQDQRAKVLPYLPQVSTSAVDAPPRSILEQHFEAPPLDPHASHRIDSPINSLISLPQPVLTFRTPYDSIAPLEFSSDSPPYDDRHGQYVDPPQEPEVRPSYADYEPQVCQWGTSSSDVLEFYDPRQGVSPESFRPLTTSYLSLAPAQCLPGEAYEDTYDTIESQHVYDREEIFEDDIDCQYDPGLTAIFQAQNKDESEDGYFSHWQRGFPVTEESHEMVGYKPDTVDASISYRTASANDLSLGESEDEVELLEFLEGRALLLGISDQRHQMPPSVRLSGLHQAEMDVASRLQGHWRPLRL